MRKTIHEDQIEEITDKHLIQSKVISKIIFDPITIHDGEFIRINRVHHQVHKITKDGSIVLSHSYKELLPMKKRSKRQQMQSARRQLKGSIIRTIGLFDYHLTNRYFLQRAISSLERNEMWQVEKILEGLLIHFDENTKNFVKDAELPENS